MDEARLTLESGVERLPHRPLPLPESLIQDFLRQDLHVYPVVATDPDRITRRLWQRDDVFPDVGAVEQFIDYETGGLIEYLYLSYDRPDDATRIATLEFLRVHQSLFRMTHRYVEPPFQRHGIGDALLEQAEQFFHQLAAAVQRPITIELELGQFSVLKWATKHGFQSKPSQAALVQDILEHPEDFVIEPIYSTDGMVRDASIFYKGTTRRDRQSTIRLHLKKIIPQ